MSFASEIALPNQPLRVLIEIDVDQTNTQWVNEGAGIWSVNTSSIYVYVDSTLIPSSFTAQLFGDVGSVKVDNVLSTQVTALSLLSSTNESWYYDGTLRTFYIHIINNDHPELHSISLGVSNGFSDRTFTPVGGNVRYDGRVNTMPQVSISRDPLTFGKLQFVSGSISLNNADGYFDTWGDSSYIYGNEVRILIGFEDLIYSQYQQIYTGFVGKIQIGITDASIDIEDKRKQLSKQITYTCTALNALSAISAIITSAYSNIGYNSTFYDTTEWAIAQATAPTVTISMQKPDDVINIIQGICLSCFGTFIVNADGRYNFKSIDPNATASLLIPYGDILDYQQFDYDPNNAYSSVRVGYDRNWTTTNNPYTYVTNTTSESAFFNKYKTYKQKDFDTYLTGSTAATSLSTKIVDYVDTVYATFEMSLPLSYYYLELADMVYIEIIRPNGNDILGYRKCEVLGFKYNFNQLSITFNFRSHSDILTVLGDEFGTAIVTETSFIVV